MAFPVALTFYAPRELNSHLHNRVGYSDDDDDDETSSDPEETQPLETAEANKSNPPAQQLDDGTQDCEPSSVDEDQPELEESQIDILTSSSPRTATRNNDQAEYLTVSASQLLSIKTILAFPHLLHTIRPKDLPAQSNDTSQATFPVLRQGRAHRLPLNANFDDSTIRSHIKNMMAPHNSLYKVDMPAISGSRQQQYSEISFWKSHLMYSRRSSKRSKTHYLPDCRAPPQPQSNQHTSITPAACKHNIRALTPTYPRSLARVLCTRENGKAKRLSAQQISHISFVASNVL